MPTLYERTGKREWDKSRTRVLDNAAHTRWPPVFGVLRTNRRASHWHPNSSTRKIGEGARGGSISRCWKEGERREEEKEEKNEKKKLQRGWKYCYVFLVPFSVQGPLIFFPVPFLPPPHHQISYRCTMRYLLPPQSHLKRTGSYSGVLHC